MPRSLRLLHVEDDENDAQLVLRELARGGFAVESRRVASAEEMMAALADGPWDLVLSDYALPGFGGAFALELFRQHGVDAPIIMLSGTASEEQAVAALHAGARDFISKSNLARLVPAIERELAEVAERRARRAAEQVVAHQREALRHAEKLSTMGELLAGVTHELNSPLSVVLGQATLLSAALRAGPEAERADKILKAAERCVRIVRSFLALARRQSTEKLPVAVNEVVEEAVELLAHSLRLGGVELRLDLAPDLPAILGDEHQLHQAVVNLLSNASQALQQTAPPRRITVASRWHRDRQVVRLSVADNGPGVPPEIAPQIMEPFFTTKPPGQGTGLGLSLCAGIAASHGGTLALSNAPGRGAEFTFEFPAAAPAAQSGPLAAFAPTGYGAPEEAAQPGQSAAILVVDDEPQLRDLLAEVLGDCGHRVEVAEHGRDALERLATGHFDLVLSDMRMPEMDGIRLYREAIEQHPGLARRFVFLTGDTLADDAAEFLGDLRRPYLSKPFDIAAVRRVVSAALVAAELPEPGPN